jgi:hypothetical protein
MDFGIKGGGMLVGTKLWEDIKSESNVWDILSIGGGDDGAPGFSSFLIAENRNFESFFADVGFAEFNMLEPKVGKRSFTLGERISFATASRPLLIAALNASLTGEVLRRVNGCISSDRGGVGKEQMLGAGGGQVMRSRE